MASEFMILKRGRLEGPFAPEEVSARLQDGTLTETDLGQTPESYYWMPLRKLLLAQEEAAPAAEAPRFGAFMADVRERIWIAFLHYPWEAGLLCLGIGVVFAVLTFWPVLLYGPWLLAALTAGGMLFLRGRTFAGISLCAAAVLLPIIIVLLLMR